MYSRESRDSIVHHKQPARSGKPYEKDDNVSYVSSVRSGKSKGKKLKLPLGMGTVIGNLFGQNTSSKTDTSGRPSNRSLKSSGSRVSKPPDAPVVKEDSNLSMVKEGSQASRSVKASRNSKETLASGNTNKDAQSAATKSTAGGRDTWPAEVFQSNKGGGIPGVMSRSTIHSGQGGASLGADRHQQPAESLGDIVLNTPTGRGQKISTGQLGVPRKERQDSKRGSLGIGFKQKQLDPKHPPSYLARSICTLFTCFPLLPCGIVAVYYSYQSEKLQAGGDYEAALEKGATAKKIHYILWGVGTAIMLAAIIIPIVVVFAVPPDDAADTPST